MSYSLSNVSGAAKALVPADFLNCASVDSLPHCSDTPKSAIYYNSIIFLSIHTCTCKCYNVITTSECYKQNETIIFIHTCL